MPLYAIERIREILKKKKKSLRRAKILVSGVTYKKDVKDLRKSPSLRLIEALQRERCDVSYYDPIIPYLNIGTIHLHSVPFKKSVLKQFDCIIIATDHTRVDYDALLEHSSVIFDIRNVYQGKRNKKVVRL